MIIKPRITYLFAKFHKTIKKKILLKNPIKGGTPASDRNKTIAILLTYMFQQNNFVKFKNTKLYAKLK